MSKDSAAQGAVEGPETQQLVEPEQSATELVEIAGPRQRKWVGRLTVLAGSVACASALALAASRRSGFVGSKVPGLDALRKPFKLYDADAMGLPKMPDRADKYDGIEDARPVKVDEKDGMASIFVIGDWGATLPSHQTFGSFGGWDQYAQMSVAKAFKDRAAWANPSYVLNVGDNFYVDGLHISCQDPPSAVYSKGTDGLTGSDSFSLGWQQVYGDVANKPWLSVLGNHDYGGYRFDSGWPQQIGYSFVNYNWIMPARYYNKKIHHADFVAEYFMIDSNAYDAKYPNENPEHNVCSKHNYQGVGSCSKNGGMPNIQGCHDWFTSSYAVQKQWLEKKLSESKANWKIVVTHFPCGYDAEFYKIMKAKYGLDLLVTGHRHQQELWNPYTWSKYLQSFMTHAGWDGSHPSCFVTGGGGGIVSEKLDYADYGGDLLAYGFFHLTMHKDWLKIELVNTDQSVTGNMTIYPHGSKKAEEQSYWKPQGSKICAHYCGDMNNPFPGVCPMMSCAGCKACQNSQTA